MPRMNADDSVQQARSSATSAALLLPGVRRAVPLFILGGDLAGTGRLNENDFTKSWQSAGDNGAQ